MQIRVLFFGMLKDLVGRDADALSLPEGATVRDLLAHYEASVPKVKPFLPSLAVAVNQEFATPAVSLRDRDEVGLLPPVSGGSDQPAPLVRIVHERIVPHDIVPPLERPEDGAIVVFDGIVRNHSRNRHTLYLVYESYEEMALKQMHSLVADALGRFPVRNVALVHRLGRIEIGESSVLIAVYSAHRAAAFDACRYLIDTLKKTIPIWKKEFFEDGAVWADGEPFPAEIATSPRARSLSE
jgi:molybdopterin converting factor subunit 1